MSPQAQLQEPWSGLYDSLGRPLEKMPDALRPGSNTVLINDADQVLLQQRADNGAWALPGGAMESDESMETCAIREMFEERGIFEVVFL